MGSGSLKFQLRAEGKQNKTRGMMEKFNSWKKVEKNTLIYKRLNSYFAE